MRFRVLILFLALFAVGAEYVLAAIPGAIEPLRSYCLTHTDGVEVRGGVSLLIVHHARTYPANPSNWWLIPPVDERLPLELCPSTRETRLTVRVLWQGEVQVAAEITADLAGGKRIEGRTDGSGDFFVDATQPGIYTFRSKEVEKASGERDGKRYTGILHYSTLVVIVVREQAGVNGAVKVERTSQVGQELKGIPQRVRADLNVAQNFPQQSRPDVLTLVNRNSRTSSVGMRQLPVTSR
ncbi:MAG TPA: hypothetical protein VHX68_10270 [Planctomycetaceae bacterium]|jgi:hypothetical protein|nr:hypothetical protein [Planctomycetaceae bacterium]